MKAEHYLEIQAKRGGATAPSQTLAAVVSLLHAKGVFSNGDVAAAFPRATVGECPSPGAVLRLWSETPESLQQAVDLLKGMETVSVSKPQALSSWTGERKGYFRYRVPARRQKDQSPERIQARARRRANRLSSSDQLPYLNLQSLSGRQSFRLFIEIKDEENSAGPEGKPNSYGLASADRIFFVPHF